MSFVNYVYIGHIDKEVEGVWLHPKFKKDADGSYSIEVEYPIDEREALDIAKTILNSSNEINEFPEDWEASFSNGMIVCEKYNKNKQFREFIIHFVKSTKCDIYDQAGHKFLSLKDWFPNND